MRMRVGYIVKSFTIEFFKWDYEKIEFIPVGIQLLNPPFF